DRALAGAVSGARTARVRQRDARPDPGRDRSRSRNQLADALDSQDMPVFRLDKRLVFPPVDLAEDGLLAVGGDLSPQRLLLGYSQGIFPWYGPKLPILWHSPDPRMVMTARDLVINRSLRKTIRRKPYQLRIDTDFRGVLEGCADSPRPGQDGTWLVPDMIEAYVRLHELGFAHSFEAWQDDAL